MLFTGRALQGVFAAMLAPAALSLITVTFQLEKERAKAFAVFGAIAGGGAAIGLLLGGFLTEYLSWRWCFFVNIPIAVPAALAATRILRESRHRRGHYDIPGALLGTAGLAALVWGFTRPTAESERRPHRPELLGWGSAQTIGWLAGAVVLLALFVLVEQRSTNPLLPMRIVAEPQPGRRLPGRHAGRRRDVRGVPVPDPVPAGVQALHADADRAGLPAVQLSASSWAPASARSWSSRSVRARHRHRRAVGLVGLLLFSRITLESTFLGTLLPAELVMAFGMGFIFMSTTNLALVGISNDDAGVASAVVNTTQQIGGSLGTALLSTVAFTAVANYFTDRAATLTDPRGLPALISREAAVHGYGVAFRGRPACWRWPS